MKSKDVKSALGVIAISSGLLALTALAVPTIVAYTTVNQNVSQANVSYTQELNQKPAVQLASSQIPVLKVATKTPVSTIKSYFERTVTAEEIKQINEYAEKAIPLARMSSLRGNFRTRRISGGCYWMINTSTMAYGPSRSYL